jgi:hypothetical protein
VAALILTGRDRHQWRTAAPYRKMLTHTERFAVRVREEPVGITTETL